MRKKIGRGAILATGVLALASLGLLTVMANADGLETNNDGNTCQADLNDDKVVNVQDLVIVILAWGDCAACEADQNNDNVVDVLDLLGVILAWGPCN